MRVVCVLCRLACAAHCSHVGMYQRVGTRANQCSTCWTLSAHSVQQEDAMRFEADASSLCFVACRHWADFIRNSDIADVKPIGTSPLAGGARRP
jgi:hypothetical protein